MDYLQVIEVMNRMQEKALYIKLFTYTDEYLKNCD